MNLQRNQDSKEAAEAAVILGVGVEYLEYYAWPHMFSSTAGPFGGIGGQSMSTFTLEAWAYGSSAVVFCNGRVIARTDVFTREWEYRRGERRPRRKEGE